MLAALRSGESSGSFTHSGLTTTLLLTPCSPKAYGPVAEGRSPRPVACFMLGFKSRNFLCGQDCSVLPCLKAIAWRPPAWDRFPTTSSFCSCDDFRSSRPPIPRRGSYGECSVGSGDPRQRSWCVKNDRSRTTGSLPSLPFAGYTLMAVATQFFLPRRSLLAAAQALLL